MQVSVNHPIINEIKQKYSKWAFEQMLFQQSQSFSLFVKPFENPQISAQIAQMTDSKTVYLVRNIEDTKDKAICLLEQDAETNTLDGQQYNRIQCNCRFSAHHQFYCRHIFAVLNFLQIKTIQKYKLIEPRWTREYQEKSLPSVYCEARELNPDAYAKKFQIIDQGTIETGDEVPEQPLFDQDANEDD